MVGKLLEGLFRREEVHHDGDRPRDCKKSYFQQHRRPETGSRWHRIMAPLLKPIKPTNINVYSAKKSNTFRPIGWAHVEQHTARRLYYTRRCSPAKELIYIPKLDDKCFTEGENTEIAKDRNIITTGKKLAYDENLLHTHSQLGHQKILLKRKYVSHNDQTKWLPSIYRGQINKCHFANPFSEIRLLSYRGKRTHRLITSRQLPNPLSFSDGDYAERSPLLDLVVESCHEPGQ